MTQTHEERKAIAHAAQPVAPGWQLMPTKLDTAMLEAAGGISADGGVCDANNH